MCVGHETPAGLRCRRSRPQNQDRGRETDDIRSTSTQHRWPPGGSRATSTERWRIVDDEFDTLAMDHEV